MVTPKNNPTPSKKYQTKPAHYKFNHKPARFILVSYQIYSTYSKKHAT